MANVFAQAKSHSGLSIDLLDPKISSKNYKDYYSCDRRHLSGNIESGILRQPHGDAIRVEEYYRSLRQLLEAMRKPAT
jgi:hypothetical protein